ncbi:transposon Ty3-I Gag-Pol polyprotein [Nephila pilipes]|uniref:Transposon Ty3-I Gag-Pol polyprotein n=1 Tax=Nephila pilipes TaxID=299642 RepID=A0A8X6MX67_NEPPI|nr:transposon Ty3-I Gag-Pol polyprotein [Nephila pilipes]
MELQKPHINRESYTAIEENSNLSTVNKTSKYFELFSLYPDLTKPNLTNRVVKHDIEPHLVTTNQPVYFRAQLAPEKLQITKQEFHYMLENETMTKFDPLNLCELSPYTL